MLVLFQRNANKQNEEPNIDLFSFYVVMLTPSFILASVMYLHSFNEISVNHKNLFSVYIINKYLPTSKLIWKISETQLVFDSFANTELIVKAIKIIEFGPHAGQIKIR